VTDGVKDRPAGDIERHLLGLHDATRACVLRSAQGHAGALGHLLQLDVDVSAWERRLEGRPEARLLGTARRELGFAVYSATAGLYLQAFSSLRLFLELSFAAVYFSANELHRRQWVADRADFSWPRALDENEGVLAASFVREFHPSAAADASRYAATAAKCYRHCSQFLHGKIVATNTLPETLSYSETVLTDWNATAREAAEAVLYLLYCRYADELLPDDDGRLAATLEYSFLHLLSVRESLGLPVDEGSDIARRPVL
jgi:hypothetical protein